MGRCACAATDGCGAWAERHFGGVELGDARLTRRAVKVASKMAEAPEQSLPKQMGLWADLEGAYRLLNNPRVDPDALQKAHRELTRRACEDHPVVLAVQDTTDLDFTGRSNITGLGRLGDGGGRGLLQHTALAVLPEGRVLGILHQRWLRRPEAPPGETRRERQARWCQSDLWPETVRHVGEPPGNRRLIHVADRESDCYAMMRACTEMEGVGFLIRARHDRKTEPEHARLWERLSARPPAAAVEVEVSAQRSGRRVARKARLTVRFEEVSVPPPTNDPRQAGGPTLRVWAVHAAEEHPPADTEPVDWMLLTSESVRDAAGALRALEWYQRRWIIEEFHRVEKEGCRLQRTQLDDASDISRLAALTGVIAVRMLQLRDAARDEHPPPLRLLVPEVWIAVAAALAGIAPERLTVRRFWETIARRGGWLGRKHDGPPGWKTIWRGWAELELMARGAQLLSPRPRRCV